MIKFFRKIRQNLLSEGKTRKYLKYAIGEIILVMIGILLALQVNNWNIQRLEKKQQLQIFERVLEDIDNDIVELDSTLTFLDSIRPVFDKVRNDSITSELLDLGISRILTPFYMTSLNKTGVDQLKETKKKDSLSIQIIEIYNLMENSLILPHEERLAELENELTSKFREYSWYSEWMSKTIMKDNSSEELQNYFLNSMEYKHRVIFFYQRIYNNYYPGIQTSLTSLKIARESINRYFKK